MFFDLASLTKPLVTAPLALLHLDLDQDIRAECGLSFLENPVTPRHLLSHRSGLPPWLPYTGEALADQLQREYGSHPLLQKGEYGTSVYSDLGYRLLAQLIENRTRKDWRDLGQELTGLSPCPWEKAWAEPPKSLPDALDAEAWAIAAPQFPLKPQQPGLPHDANARMGMKGHAGFGASPQQLQGALEAWVSGGFPQRMALPQSLSREGRVWGLGLHQPDARWHRILATIPEGFGIHVWAEDGCESALDLDEDHESLEQDSGFWMHTGFTGPVLWVRPEDSCVIALLLNRADENGQLLNLKGLTARRERMLRLALSQWL